MLCPKKPQYLFLVIDIKFRYSNLHMIDNFVCSLYCKNGIISLFVHLTTLESSEA